MPRIFTGVSLSDRTGVSKYVARAVARELKQER